MYYDTFSRVSITTATSTPCPPDARGYLSILDLSRHLMNVTGPLYSFFLLFSSCICGTRAILPSIGDSPRLKPLQVLELLVASLHAKTDWAKQDVKTNDHSVEYAVQAPLELGGQFPSREIQAEASDEYREPEGRIVVVDVGNASHGDEWIVVQEPADDGIDTGIVELINLPFLQIREATLPADEVPGEHGNEDTEGRSGAPVDKWVSEEEVLRDF